MEVNGRFGPANRSNQKGIIMLSWTLAFLIVALLAALLGFAGIAGTAAWMAQVLFVVFLVLFLVSLIFGRKRAQGKQDSTKGMI